MKKYSIAILGIACATFLCAPNFARSETFSQMPEPSAGFVPRISYAQDGSAVIHAIKNTLSSLSIPVVSSSSNEIDTEYVEGPTSQTPKGTTRSRFRFKIAVKPVGTGGTTVHIAVFTEANSGVDTTAWHDVTLFNMGVARKTGNWLFENIEHNLGGSTSTPAIVAASSTAASGSLSDSHSVGNAEVREGSHSDGVELPMLALMGVRLGMTKSEAIRAMNKEYPNMKIMLESYRQALNLQDAGTPLGGDTNRPFAPFQGLESADQAKKAGDTLVMIEAIDNDIAQDVQGRSS